jgi:hypothetical protein
MIWLTAIVSTNDSAVELTSPFASIHQPFLHNQDARSCRYQVVPLLISIALLKNSSKFKYYWDSHYRACKHVTPATTMNVWRILEHRDQCVCLQILEFKNGINAGIS